MDLKLSKLLRELSTQDPNATATAVLAIQKIKSDAELVQMLESIYLPTDKYKTIIRFAGLLGIPSERFVDFVNQQEINV